MPSTSISEAQESRSASGRSRRLYVGECLGACGLLFIGTGLNLFVFSLLPLQPAEPLWQLGFISSILANSIPILIGCLLIVCAAGFAQGDKKLAWRTSLVTKAAPWLSIAFLFLIPLQFYSAHKVIRGQTLEREVQVGKLKVIVNRLKATRNEAEFRAFIASQPNAPQLPDKLDVPFEKFKQRTLTNVQGRMNAAVNEAEAQEMSNWNRFVSDSAKNTIQILILASAFSVLGGLKSASTGLFSPLLRILGIDYDKK